MRSKRTCEAEEAGREIVVYHYVWHRDNRINLFPHHVLRALGIAKSLKPCWRFLLWRNQIRRPLRSCHCLSLVGIAWNVFRNMDEDNFHLKITNKSTLGEGYYFIEFALSLKGKLGYEFAQVDFLCADCLHIPANAFAHHHKPCFLLLPLRGTWRNRFFTSCLFWGVVRILHLHSFSPKGNFLLLCGWARLQSILL